MQNKDIHRNTIADACTRRLQLDGRDDFLDLVDKWLKGDPEPIKRILKLHTPDSIHYDIEYFFYEN